MRANTSGLDFGLPPIFLTSKLTAEATSSPLRHTSKKVTRGSLPPHTKATFSFRHFVKAADQSCRLEEGCSSARRAPSSYNDRPSFPQQSAGYGCKEDRCVGLLFMDPPNVLPTVWRRQALLSRPMPENPRGGDKLSPLLEAVKT